MVGGASNLLLCLGWAANQAPRLVQLFAWGPESSRTAYRTPWADKVTGLVLLMGRAAVWAMNLEHFTVLQAL